MKKVQVWGVDNEGHRQMQGEIVLDDIGQLTATTGVATTILNSYSDNGSRLITRHEPEAFINSLSTRYRSPYLRVTLPIADDSIQKFDAESGRTQERDQGGRFADEGKASQESGYKSPNEYEDDLDDIAINRGLQPSKDLSGRSFDMTEKELRTGAPDITLERAALMNFNSVKVTTDEGETKNYNLDRQFLLGNATDRAIYGQDAAKYRDLKDQWSRVNNSLLDNVDNPESPEAQSKLSELNKIVKDMHGLHADPGGINGLGLPGGPRDIIVVGAGPGGLSTAINGATDGLDVTFIDTQPVVGGQAKYSSRVENYPGFPIGVTGEKLAKSMYEQATRLGAEAKLETQVTGLEYDPDTGIKTVLLSDGTKLKGRSVVIAGGVQFKHLPDFPGSEASGIIYGDGKALAEVGKGKDVTVIGGSNGAAQAALGAARTANHVYVISRSSLGNSMSDYQVSALRNHPKITVVENDQIKALEYDNKTMLPTTVHTQKGQKFPTSALGVFAGSAPDTNWIPSNIARVSEPGAFNGKIRTNSDLEVLDGSGQVAMPGVYAVGDVREGSVQRILASAAEGQIASRNAFNYFAKQLGVKHPNRARDVSIKERIKP